jgi:CubicO group peptidase (beta-lactamase class C family)
MKMEQLSFDRIEPIRFNPGGRGAVSVSVAAIAPGVSMVRAATHLASFLAVTLCAWPALAMSDGDLRAALAQRFDGDRSGACVAAAMIENGTTAKAYYCADPKAQRPYDDHTAFEIGSIGKTMTAALLAEFIARGEVTLADPLAKLLPPGTSVPSFNDRQITLGDVVTHSSGLPSLPPQWDLSDIDNPYARLTEADVLGALAATQLTRRPGSKFEYSNFAMIVLSDAIAKRSGTDYETLLRAHLLVPLGMTETYIATPPPGVHPAQGHASNARPAGPWDFPVNLAGVGGVRATLPDMVRYLEGELGTRESTITPALALTQQQVTRVSGRIMAMNWFLLRAGGHTIAMHEGDTGGFTSFIAFDRAAQRGVVLLSDTSMSAFGALTLLGRHVLDPSVAARPPITAAVADPKLIDALVGHYRLENGLVLELRRKGAALAVRAEGQREFEMGYDSAGDFYPLELDAVLRPERRADGGMAFAWYQLGARFAATRLGPLPASINRWVPGEADLKEFEGNFPLTPRFALRFTSVDAKLTVQGTGQRALELAPVEKDIFVSDVVHAEFGFARDAAGKVVSVTLKQNGQVLRGARE